MTNRSHVRCRGIALIWTSLVIVVMLLLMGLAIDTVYVVYSAQQLQVGADASALAGALHVRRNHDDARAAAIDVAQMNTVATAALALADNPGNAASGDVVIGYYSRQNGTFTTQPTGSLAYNAFRARARRTAAAPGGPLDTLFAAMVGINTWNVQREATAIVTGDIGPAILVLNEEAPNSLQLTGGAMGIYSSNGAVYVNGGATNSGPGTLDAPEVHIVGDQGPQFDQVQISGELIEADEPHPDPLELLPEPNRPPGPATPPITYNNGNRTLNPGVYSDITIRGGNTHVTFNPGLYYIEGSFSHTGGVIDATDGVMFFFAPGATLELAAGQGTFQVVGMNPTSYSPHGPGIPSELANIPVPLFFSRQNTSTAVMRGNNNWQMGGTIYAPNVTLNIFGNPNVFANGVIAGRLHVGGNADLFVNYQDQFPRIPRRVFLIE